MNEGKNRGLQVMIPEGSQKDVTKSWTSFMKKYGAKTFKMKRLDDYASTEVNMPSISSAPFTAYTIFNNTPEGVYLNVFMDLGTSYLNSALNTEKSAVAKTVIATFAKDVFIAALNKEVKDNGKKLDKLNMEQSSLENLNAQYHQNIESAKALIEQREAAIETNVVSQNVKKQEIVKQKDILQTIKAKLGKY